MSFALDNIIIDRIQSGLATDFSDRPLYVLSQLKDATIKTTADSTDANDNVGTLVRRFYRGKKGEFNATNAMLSLSIMAASSGNEKELATKDHIITMPKFVDIKGTEKTLKLEGLDPNTLDSVALCGVGNNGSMTNVYKRGATASATEFAITEDGVLTLPTPDAPEDKYLVNYFRKVSSGGKLVNSANSFPKTCRLYLKALAVDPCSPDTLRGIYIFLPSFMVSPEVDINLSTDATLDYTGALQVDYCSAEKALYYVMWADDDLE